MRLRIPKKYSVTMYVVVLMAMIGASMSLEVPTWVPKRFSFKIEMGPGNAAPALPAAKNSAQPTLIIPSPSILGDPKRAKIGQSAFQPVAIAAAIFMIALVGIVYALRYFRLRQATARQMVATERKERLARSFTDLVADPVIVINAEGIIESCNSGAETILGYRETELVSRPFTLLLSDPEVDITKLKRDAAFAAANSHSAGKLVRVPLLRKDGKNIIVDVNIGRSEIDGDVMYAGTLRDVPDMNEGAIKLRFDEPGIPLSDLIDEIENLEQTIV